MVFGGMANFHWAHHHYKDALPVADHRSASKFSETKCPGRNTKETKCFGITGECFCPDTWKWKAMQLNHPCRVLSQSGFSPCFLIQWKYIFYPGVVGYRRLQSLIQGKKSEGIFHYGHFYHLRLTENSTENVIEQLKPSKSLPSTDNRIIKPARRDLNSWWKIKPFRNVPMAPEPSSQRAELGVGSLARSASKDFPSWEVWWDLCPAWQESLLLCSSTQKMFVSCSSASEVTILSARWQDTRALKGTEGSVGELWRHLFDSLFFVGLVEQSFHSDWIMASFPDQAPLPTKPYGETRPGTGEKVTEIPQQCPKQTNKWKSSLSQPGSSSAFLSHHACWWSSKVITGPCSSAGHSAASFGTGRFLFDSLPSLRAPFTCTVSPPRTPGIFVF